MASKHIHLLDGNIVNGSARGNIACDHVGTLVYDPSWCLSPIAVTCVSCKKTVAYKKALARIQNTDGNSPTDGAGFEI